MPDPDELLADFFAAEAPPQEPPSCFPPCWPAPR